MCGLQKGISAPTAFSFSSEQPSAWPIRCLTIKNPISRKRLWFRQGGCTVFLSHRAKCTCRHQPICLMTQICSFWFLCLSSSNQTLLPSKLKCSDNKSMTNWSSAVASPLTLLYEQFEFVGNKLKLRLKQIWTLKTKLNPLLHLQ